MTIWGLEVVLSDGFFLQLFSFNMMPQSVQTWENKNITDWMALSVALRMGAPDLGWVLFRDLCSGEARIPDCTAERNFKMTSWSLWVSLSSPGWTWTHRSLHSLPHKAGIKGMHHNTWPKESFLKKVCLLYVGEHFACIHVCIPWACLLDHQELMLQMVTNYEDQTWVLVKSNKCY